MSHQPKLTRCQWDFVREQLGEGVHVAFRKASDHVTANRAWQAISDMPDDHWGRCLDFVMEGIFGARPESKRAQR